MMMKKQGQKTKPSGRRQKKSNRKTTVTLRRSTPDSYVDKGEETFSLKRQPSLEPAEKTISRKDNRDPDKIIIDPQINISLPPHKNQTSDRIAQVTRVTVTIHYPFKRADRVHNPPKLFELMLAFFLSPEEREDTLGDFEEYFRRNHRHFGRFFAMTLYLRDAISKIIYKIPQSCWKLLTRIGAVYLVSISAID